MLLPGQVITLNEKDLKLLGSEMSLFIDDLESTYSQLFEDIRIWWKWYDAMPQNRVKTFPFANAPLSRDTEILTREGWLRVDEVSLGDFVLTRRDQDSILEWKPVLAKPEVYAEHLLHFQSSSVDQMVTQNHTMVCYSAKGEIHRRPAHKLFGKTGVRIVLTGSGLLGGKNPEKLFGLPAGDVMEFLGWYLAEGWFNKSKSGGGTIFIGQSKAANPLNCAKLETLFRRLSIRYKLMKTNSGYSLYASDFPAELRKHIYEQGLCDEKFLPSFVFDLHPDLLWRLMEGMVLGDGCISKDLSNGYAGGISYYSTSKRLADGFQILTALVGYRGTIETREPCLGGSIQGRQITGVRTGYTVKLLTRDRAKVERCRQSIVPYQDTAFCVTVENHAIYIRRNGIPSWTGNSNLVVPLIQIMSDSLVARLYGGIFGAGKRVWTTFTENEQMEKLVKNVGRHMNWAARRDFNIRLPVYDWLSELVPIGSSVIKGGWRSDVRSVFSHQGKGGQRRIVAQEVRFNRGAQFEHIPREQILWDTNTQISEAPFVAQELHLAWSYLAYLARVNPGWDKEVIEKLRGHSGVNSPSKKVTDEKKERDSKSKGTESVEPHDIREVWCDWPILRSMGFDKAEKWRPDEEDAETPNIPLVATIHRQTRQILQLKAAPYFWPGKPFFDGFIRKRSGRGHAVGLAKRLEHPQLAFTTILNQAIDARTRANSIWGMTNSRRLADEPIDPSKLFHVPDMNSFRELTLPTNNFQDLSLIQAVQTIAERLTGQSDPNFGQNTRQGGHPSPATSTLALLQQGDTMSLPTRELLRIQLAKMGEFAATLYQQFETNEDGRLKRVFGDTDARDLEEWLYPTQPIVGNIEFDLASMSQSHSPEAEMNRAIQVTQMNTNYWAFVMRALQVVQQGGNNPALVQIAMKSIEAQTQAQMRFLEAADVDDIERFVAELNRQQGDSQGLQQALGGLRELATARSPVDQSAMGPGPGLNGGGALPQAGGFGGY